MSRLRLENFGRDSSSGKNQSQDDCIVFATTDIPFGVFLTWAAKGIIQITVLEDCVEKIFVQQRLNDDKQKSTVQYALLIGLYLHWIATGIQGFSKATQSLAFIRRI